MSHKKISLLAASAMLALSLPAAAQTGSEQSQDAQENRVGAIIGALFGDRLGASTSIERQ